MMIEYLEKLVEEKKYAEAIDLSERLIKQGDNTPKELLAISTAQLLARMRADDFEGATSSGLTAVSLARELLAWDDFGFAAGNLGVAHSRLGNSEAAMQWWFEFLAHLPKYRAALRHEAMVWYNLGTLHVDRDPQHAASFMRKAVDSAKQHGDDRYAHGIRQALIQLHMRTRDWSKVPPLLAQCAHYLRHNPGVPLYNKSRLFHLQLRAEFALNTGRPLRALLVAVQGVSQAEGMELNAYLLHMLIARILLPTQVGAAVAHALAARQSAVAGHLSGLAREASDFMYQTLDAHPTATADFQSYVQTVLQVPQPVSHH